MKLLALLMAMATPDAAEPGRAAAAEIAAAEARFAAEADRIGIVPAFRQFVGPEAIMFLPRPIVINPRLDKASWPGDLDWRPEGIGVSADARYAFSLGPSAWRYPTTTDHGYYLTIWQRQPDGNWRFIVDRATPMTENVYDVPVTAPRLMVSDSAGKPLDIDALEQALAADMAGKGGAAIKARLAPGAFVLRKGQRLAVADASRALKPDCKTRQSMLGKGAAADGSFAWSYGSVHCEGQSASVGHYVRVWQTIGGKAKITVDEMSLDPSG